MARSTLDRKYIAQLVEDSKKGDSNAFASLFAITYDQQYNLAYSYLWDKALAQDVVFALYLNTLMLISDQKHSKDFITYLTRDNVATCEALAAEKGIEPPKGKVHVPPWPIDDAKTLLEYVFFESHYEQNTIPLEVLVEHNQYVQRRFVLQKVMVAVVIIMFAIVPLSFITPKVSVAEASMPKRENYRQYDVAVDSFIPIETVEATVNGNSTPVYQSGKRSFYVLPERNGQLEVKVTYLNHRHATSSTEITGVDHEVPVLQKSVTREGKVLLYVSDSGGVGVDYNSVFALDVWKKKVMPLKYNGAIGEIIFAFPTMKLDVYIPDRTGNTLHAVIRNPQWVAAIRRKAMAEKRRALARQRQAGGTQQTAGAQQTNPAQQAANSQQTTNTQQTAGTQQAGGTQQAAGTQQAGGTQQAAGTQQNAGTQQTAATQQASADTRQTGEEPAGMLQPSLLEP